MKELYPPIEPYAVHALQVGGGHTLHVEECGNPQGIPAVFLHGGPGSGCKPYHRSFFNPKQYRAILFDQRGAGRSTPHGHLRDNTTAHLLSDLEVLRRHLHIDRWLLFGGSWGATLALLYAQAHPQRVSGMALRGSFLARQQDLDWYIQDGGVNRIYPERWGELMSVLHCEGQGDPLAAIHALLQGQDELAKRRVAKAWSVWGAQVALGEAFSLEECDGHLGVVAMNQAKLELHYAVNHYFIAENQILDQCPKLPKVPTVILHGRRDLVCPVEAAVTLHRHLPGSQLRLLPRAGHLAGDPDMIDALVAVADDMALQLGQ